MMPMNLGLFDVTVLMVGAGQRGVGLPILGLGAARLQDAAELATGDTAHATLHPIKMSTS
jgi:hypothetical protein